MNDTQYEYGPDAKAEVKKQAKRTFSTLSLAFVAYITVAYVVRFFFSAFLTKIGFFASDFYANYSVAVNTVLSSFYMYVFGIPLFFLIAKSEPRTPIAERKISFPELLTLFLISRFLVLAGSYVSAYVTGILEYALNVNSKSSVDTMVTGLPVWLLILLTVIVAPVVEELIFRRAVIDRLRPYGRGYAVFFSALIFSLAHANIYQIAYAFLLGLLFGYVYARSGKISYTIGLHVITNFLGSVVALPVFNLRNELTAVTTGEELITFLRGVSLFRLFYFYAYVGIFFGLAVMGLVLFILYFKNFKKFFRESGDLTARECGSAAFGNAGTIIFLIVSGGLTVLSFYLSTLSRG